MVDKSLSRTILNNLDVNQNLKLILKLLENGSTEIVLNL